MIQFEDYKQYLSPALAKGTNLIIKSGKGCYVTDVNGKQYLDFVQGIAVNALGHCHPKVVSAILEQVQQVIDASFNLVNFESTLTLAKKIASVTPQGLTSVFFSNGGAEAIDGALKLAKVSTKRPAVIAFRGSFHGRTVGAATVTGSNSKYRKFLEPLMGGVYFTPYPSKDLCPAGFDEHQRSEYCLKELQSLFDYLVAPETVAAILMEPVQGEGGYVVPPAEFVHGVREICDKHGILLIFDEIQAGYGRTGKMFASQNFGVVPDIMTCGKAIAGGLPMSAIISTPKIMEEWHAGMHGTTFGGNPVCAAAGNAVLDVFEEEHVIDNCIKQGAYLKENLLALQKKYPVIGDVRGLGLMLAIDLRHPDGSAAGDKLEKLKDLCLKNGMLTLSCGVHNNCMRFATPLNIGKKELDEGLAIIETGLKQL